MQKANERFDMCTFLGEVRRIAKSCQFEFIEGSMTHDLVVMGVKDDATRKAQAPTNQGGAHIGT